MGLAAYALFAHALASVATRSISAIEPTLSNTSVDVEHRQVVDDLPGFEVDGDDSLQEFVGVVHGFGGPEIGVVDDAAVFVGGHGLAFHAPLEVLDKIFCDQANPFLTADECFQRGPLGLELLLAILFFHFGDFLDLRIDFGQFSFVQAQLGDAAFVEDRHRRLVDRGKNRSRAIDMSGSPRLSLVGTVAKQLSFIR